jgi:hypothetical protein
VERLESRALLVAEGEVFELSRTVNGLDLVGAVNGTVDWGDGTSSPATIQSGGQPRKLTARIDYSLDTNQFFTTPRRQLLQAAVDSVMGWMNDNLTAIQPSGQNSWTASFLHPSTGQVTTRANMTVAANELVIFAGSRAMPGPQLGAGGPGGFSGQGDPAFLSNLQSRGQGTVSGNNASDFGPWGGSLAFDTTANWYFGTDPSGIVAGQADFVTTVIHEFYHVLGFGTAPSWTRLVQGTRFTGPKSVAAYDGSGNVPLSQDGAHWSTDLMDDGRETIMDPDQRSGTRKTSTLLDLAALDDIGWDVASTNIRVVSNHVYPDNGSYPISIRLTGSQLGQATATSNAVVTNVPPTLVVTTNKTILAGTPLSITDIVSITDPGFRNTASAPNTFETFNYSINWGDDSAPTTGTATIDQHGNATRPTLASFNATHTFEMAGTYTVRITVTDDDGGTSSTSFRVTVTPQPRLTLSLSRDRIAENSGPSAQLTITRSGTDHQTPLTVNLASSDTSEATLPITAVIPANLASVTVPVTAVDDSLLDGEQVVELSATASNTIPSAITLVVTDHEVLTATILTPQVAENAGAAAVRLRLSRSNTNTDNPQVVSLTFDKPNELETMTQATIPAGRQSVEIRLGVINDEIPEKTQIVRIQASAEGYTGAQSTVAITDDEPPAFQNQVNPFDVNGDGRVRSIDALQVINYLNRQGGPQEMIFGQNPFPPFLDVTGDYFITPIDALRIINAINRGDTGPEGEGLLGSLEETQEMLRQKKRLGQL